MTGRTGSAEFTGFKGFFVRLRAALKLALAAGLTILHLSLAAAGWILPTRLRKDWARAVVRSWAKTMLLALGVRVQVFGTPQTRPGMVVSNHLSYLDVLVIAATLPCRFVAKAEVRSWPVMGWACRSVETIFVDRDSRRSAHGAAAIIGEAISAGDTVVLFAEGTSSAGHNVMPFRSPLLAPAAANRHPVLPIAVSYSTSPPERPAFLSVCWWGDTEFGEHVVELARVGRVHATLRIAADTSLNGDRKALAQELRRAVFELFEPVVDFEPFSPRDPRPVSVVSPSAQDLVSAEDVA